MAEDPLSMKAYPMGYPEVHEHETKRDFLLNWLSRNINLSGECPSNGCVERSVCSEPSADNRRWYDSDDWLEEQCKLRAFDERLDELAMVESEARSLPLLYCSSNSGQRYQDKSPFEGTLEWIFIPTNLILETLSGFFDQLSSPKRPRYALIAMLMSIVAVLFCVVEFAHKTRRKEEVGTKKGRVWSWFYHGSFVDNFGMLCSVAQCVLSIVQYIFFCGHSDNPIKLSFFPILFALSVAFANLRSKCCACFGD